MVSGQEPPIGIGHGKPPPRRSLRSLRFKPSPQSPVEPGGKISRPMVSGQEPLIGIKVAAATVSLSEAKPNVSLKLPQAAVSLSEAPPCSSEAVRLSQAKPGGSFKAGNALPVRLRSQATGSLRYPCITGLPIFPANKGLPWERGCPDPLQVVGDTVSASSLRLSARNSAVARKLPDPASCGSHSRLREFSPSGL